MAGVKLRKSVLVLIYLIIVLIIIILNIIALVLGVFRALGADDVWRALLGLVMFTINLGETIIFFKKRPTLGIIGLLD